MKAVRIWSQVWVEEMGLTYYWEIINQEMFLTCVTETVMGTARLKMVVESAEQLP